MSEEQTGKLTSELAAEIEKAVDDVVKDISESKQETGGDKNVDTGAGNVSAGSVGNDSVDSGEHEGLKKKGGDSDNSVGDGSDASSDSGSSIDSDLAASGDTAEFQGDFQPEILSEETLARAIDVGIPLSDALSFPSEAALDKVISAMERRRTSERKTESDKEAKTSGNDPFSSLPKLDPESYDPEVIKYFDALTGIVKKQHEELSQSRLRDQQRQQYDRERHASEVENWFDKQISDLGDEYKEALGEGRYRSLNQGSQQFKTREAIAETMSIFLSGYNAQGKAPPPREEIFDMAVGMVLADRLEQIHNTKVANDLDKRSKQHIHRAGGRKADKTDSAEQEAAEALARRFSIKI